MIRTLTGLLVLAAMVPCVAIPIPRTKPVDITGVVDSYVWIDDSYFKYVGGDFNLSSAGSAPHYLVILKTNSLSKELRRTHSSLAKTDGFKGLSHPITRIRLKKNELLIKITSPQVEGLNKGSELVVKGYTLSGDEFGVGERIRFLSVDGKEVPLYQPAIDPNSERGRLVGIWWGTLTDPELGSKRRTEHWIIERKADGTYRVQELQVDHTAKMYFVFPGEPSSGIWNLTGQALTHDLDEKDYEQTDIVKFEKQVLRWEREKRGAFGEEYQVQLTEKRIERFAPPLGKDYRQVTEEEFAQRGPPPEQAPDREATIRPPSTPAERARIVKYCADVIKEGLDLEQWRFEMTKSAIVIESKFEFTIGRRVSPGLSLPPKRKYRIELSFRDYLGREEFIALVNRRTKHLANAHYGSHSKEEWVDSKRFLKENPLPRYSVVSPAGEPSSVYVLTSEDSSVTWFPVEKHAEARGIIALLDSILWEESSE